MFHEDIEKLTKQNNNFREVVFTNKYSQLVIMSLAIGEEIGAETHAATDQIIVVVEGDGEAHVGDERFGIEEDDLVCIPAGVKHNIKNIGDEELKLYTVYAPPEHTQGTIEATKADSKKH